MNAIEAIVNRQTNKLLGNVEQPVQFDTDRSKEINRLIQVAGNAPFHYAASSIHRRDEVLNGIEPWRVYVLHYASCRKLLTYFLSKKIETGKIGQLLAACRSLIITNWCPDPSKNEPKDFFEPSVRNMEHIAATAAFAQNLITAATSEGFRTYWSSGGILREPVVFDYLNMQGSQILLAAIFLFDADSQATEILPGKLRPHRGSTDSWSRVLSL